MQLIGSLRAGLDGAAPSHAKRANGLHRSRARLRRPRGRLGLGGACGRDGIDRVGLAALSTEPTIRTVDLHDDDALGSQIPGQAGTVAAGAFYAHSGNLAVLRQPGQQASVARRCGGELVLAE
jgi:hypothetical protein